MSPSVQIRLAKRMAMALVLLLAPGVGFAIPFSLDLTIMASVGLNSASLAPYSGTQTGALSMTSGGVSSMSTIDGITVTGSDPLGGALTDIGDRVGIDFHAGGTELDTEFYGNYGFSLANNSAADTYRVTLGFESMNLVQVMGDLDNAVFAESKMFLASGVEELFYTYRYIDLLYYEDFDDTCNGCLFTYDLLLGAGEMIDLYGDQGIFGGAYDPGTGYEIDLSTTVSILDVANLTAPPTGVPEPTTVLLFAVGVFLLIAVKRRGERQVLL